MLACSRLVKEVVGKSWDLLDCGKHSWDANCAKTGWANDLELQLAFVHGGDNTPPKRKTNAGRQGSSVALMREFEVHG